MTTEQTLCFVFIVMLVAILIGIILSIRIGNNLADSLHDLHQNRTVVVTTSERESGLFLVREWLSVIPYEQLKTIASFDVRVYEPDADGYENKLVHYDSIHKLEADFRLLEYLYEVRFHIDEFTSKATICFFVSPGNFEALWSSRIGDKIITP